MKQVKPTAGEMYTVKKYYYGMMFQELGEQVDYLTKLTEAYHGK